MPRMLAALILVLAAAACSTGPKETAKPDGKVFRLHPERWAEAGL